MHQYALAIGTHVSPTFWTPTPTPHLPPHPISPGCHRAAALGVWHPTSHFHWLSILHMVVQCNSDFEYDFIPNLGDQGRGVRIPSRGCTGVTVNGPGFPVLPSIWLTTQPLPASPQSCAKGPIPGYQYQQSPIPWCVEQMTVSSWLMSPDRLTGIKSSPASSSILYSASGI